MLKWEQEVVPERQGGEFFLAVTSQWKNPKRILPQRLPAKWRFIFASREDQASGSRLADSQFKSSSY